MKYQETDLQRNSIILFQMEFHETLNVYYCDVTLKLSSSCLANLIDPVPRKAHRRWSNIVQMLYKCFVFTLLAQP